MINAANIFRTGAERTQRVLPAEVSDALRFSNLE